MQPDFSPPPHQSFPDHPQIPLLLLIPPLPSPPYSSSFPTSHHQYPRPPPSNPTVSSTLAVCVAATGTGHHRRSPWLGRRPRAPHSARQCATAHSSSCVRISACARRCPRRRRHSRRGRVPLVWVPSGDPPGPSSPLPARRIGDSCVLHDVPS
ncbi:proline-rich receptor-like protein kinase PERK12 [Iris pallida]|uniref:Proline-rich receptor-like protein kinase PERK12 n=1 Tax=Iris pallida TaxID=29817 RepID=A0AAX6DSK0_IRIPA|nr:proline-rich receptor-like protein kinase PERK12 [Iris pallida]